MAASPSIAIIITAYNRAEFLSATIQSVLAQTRRDFELLIWDDGSIDDSLAIARHYEQGDNRIRVVASPHQGLSPTLKAAVAATTAPFLGWVDSDDLLAPTALEETAAVLERLPEVGMVYTNHHLIDANGRDHGLGHTCQVPYSPKQLLVDFMTFHFRLIRRSVYERVGGIDPTYPTAEDYDLCLKLSEVTEIRHIARPLYFYRRHSANKTNEQMLTIQWTQRAIESAIVRRNLDTQYQLQTRIAAYFSLRSRSTPNQIQKATELIIPEPKTPLVSIVIPCHNAAPRLDACLRSCVMQTYPNLEILVVDNHSTDDSMSIAKRWSEQAERPIRILQCEAAGANAARNWGFRQAKGDYIQWLDADDELEMDKLSLQVNALEQQIEMDIAFGDWEWQFINQNRTTQFKFLGQQYSDMPLQMLWDNWRPPHSYLLRRSAAERLDRSQAWHPNTSVCMDREYFTLAALLGLRFQYVPGSTVRYYWWSSHQLSRSRSYRERVSSRSRMFQRFRDVSEVRWAAGVQANHRFLLQQNWEVWRPVFTIHSTESQAVLAHLESKAVLSISLPQQQIATALLTLPMAQTLEDMARWVLRQLWSELITEMRQDAKNLPTIEQLTLGLAARLGVSVRSPASVNDGAKAALPITPLLYDFPLFAPSFGEYRLMVQGFLEALRQQGWLQRGTGQFNLQRKENLTLQRVNISQPHVLLPKSQKSNAWALAPEALAWLQEFIQLHQIRLIVELGSGQSTIAIAKLKQQGVIAKSLTLEHDLYWQQDTCAQLQAEQLLEYAKIQHCPLRVQHIQSEPHLWYDSAQIVPFAADLILIDGPPHTVGDFARYPALHVLKTFIQPGTWLVLDDYHRSPEQETVKRWLKEFPALCLMETLSIDTGIAVLQFQN